MVRVALLVSLVSVVLCGVACLPAERCARGGIVVDESGAPGCTVVFDECEARTTIDLRVACDGTVCTCTKAIADNGGVSQTQFGSFAEGDACEESAGAGFGDFVDTANDNCGLGWQVDVVADEE